MIARSGIGFVGFVSWVVRVRSVGDGVRVVEVRRREGWRRCMWRECMIFDWRRKRGEVEVVGRRDGFYSNE